MRMVHNQARGATHHVGCRPADQEPSDSKREFGAAHNRKPGAARRKKSALARGVRRRWRRRIGWWLMSRSFESEARQDLINPGPSTRPLLQPAFNQ